MSAATMHPLRPSMALLISLIPTMLFQALGYQKTSTQKRAAHILDEAYVIKAKCQHLYGECDVRGEMYRGPSGSFPSDANINTWSFSIYSFCNTALKMHYKYDCFWRKLVC